LEYGKSCVITYLYIVDRIAPTRATTDWSGSPAIWGALEPSATQKETIDEVKNVQNLAARLFGRTVG